MFTYAWSASCLLIDIVILPKIMKSTYIKFNLLQHITGSFDHAHSLFGIKISARKVYLN